MGNPGRRPLNFLLLVFWAGLTVVFLSMAAAYSIGADPPRDTDTALGALFFAAVTSALAVHRVVHLRQGKKAIAALAPAEEPYRLPGPASTARAPMRGLAEAETALADVLNQLTESDWVEHARQSAATAATELRALASKLVAVETALDHSPPADRPALEAGLRQMREWLDKGLEAYRGVVGAASRMLIASAPAPAMDELTEAADRLANLAKALTELPGFPDG